MEIQTNPNCSWAQEQCLKVKLKSKILIERLCYKSCSLVAGYKICHIMANLKILKQS